MQNKIPNFEDKYLKLLSQTAVADYKDIFAPFGLNPESREFWQGGVSLIEEYIDQLSTLLNE